MSKTEKKLKIENRIMQSAATYKFIQLRPPNIANL